MLIFNFSKCISSSSSSCRVYSSLPSFLHHRLRSNRSRHAILNAEGRAKVEAIASLRITSHHSLWEIDEIASVGLWNAASIAVSTGQWIQTCIQIQYQFIGLVLHFWCMQFSLSLSLCHPASRTATHTHTHPQTLRWEKLWNNDGLLWPSTNLHVYLINQNTMNFERERERPHFSLACCVHAP